jgi:hypothetical protein
MKVNFTQSLELYLWDFFIYTLSQSMLVRWLAKGYYRIFCKGKVWLRFSFIAVLAGTFGFVTGLASLYLAF